MAELLTELEASRYKRCDKRTIRSAIERGDLVVVRSKLRRSDLDSWSPKERRPRHAPPEPPPDPDAPPAPEPPPSPAVRLKQIELERAEQQWAKDRGTLIERAEVVRILTEFGHRVRREIQSHPRKMQAAMVAGIHCKRCGGAIEGSIIAIEAERYTRDLLRLLSADPLGDRGSS